MSKTLKCCFLVTDEISTRVSLWEQLPVNFAHNVTVYVY